MAAYKCGKHILCTKFTHYNCFWNLIIIQEIFRWNL